MLAADRLAEKTIVSKKPGSRSWNPRLYLAEALAFSTLLLAGPASAADRQYPHCPPGQTPVLTEGFKNLSDLLPPEKIGIPTDCPYPDSASGDILQPTQRPDGNPGLFFWRKSTNIPTFTDGSNHWALTGDGLNSWEGASIDPPNVFAQIEAQSNTAESIPGYEAYESYGDPNTLYIDYSAHFQKYNIRIVPTSPQKEQWFFNFYRRELAKPNNLPTILHVVDMDHPYIAQQQDKMQQIWFFAGTMGKNETLTWKDTHLIGDRRNPQYYEEWIAFNENAFDDFYLKRMSGYKDYLVLGQINWVLLRGLSLGSGKTILDPIWGEHPFTLQWSPKDNPNQVRRMDKYTIDPQTLQLVFPS